MDIRKKFRFLCIFARPYNEVLRPIYLHVNLPVYPPVGTVISSWELVQLELHNIFHVDLLNLKEAVQMIRLIKM